MVARRDDFVFVLMVHTSEQSVLPCTEGTVIEASSSSIVQELCESRGGRPELSVLTSLLVSVDVKNS